MDLGEEMIPKILDKKVIFCFILTLLLISLNACGPKESLYPLNGPPLRSEIVFMPDGSPRSTTTDATLGFINADGSNRQEYTFTLIGGAPSMFGQDIPTYYASFPRWSKKGQEVVFTIRNTAPNIRIIDENGRMWGKECDDIDAGHVTTDKNGYVLSSISKYDEAFEDYMETGQTAFIARYDLKSCQVVSVFSLPVPFNSMVSEINESEDGYITASYYDFDKREDRILIYDTKTNECQTLPGYHPSLSDDGSIMAYYNRQGMLVIRNMKTGMERVLIRVFPANSVSRADVLSMPGWSPDNEWLVYNTPEGEIYKINIETKENTYLTYGWAPDWR